MIILQGLASLVLQGWLLSYYRGWLLSYYRGWLLSYAFIKGHALYFEFVKNLYSQNQCLWKQSAQLCFAFSHEAAASLAVWQTFGGAGKCNGSNQKTFANACQHTLLDLAFYCQFKLRKRRISAFRSYHFSQFNTYCIQITCLHSIIYIIIYIKYVFNIIYSL